MNPEKRSLQHSLSVSIRLISTIHRLISYTFAQCATVVQSARNSSIICLRALRDNILSKFDRRSQTPNTLHAFSSITFAILSYIILMLNIRYKVTDLAFIGCDHIPVIPDSIDLNNMLMIYDIYSFDCSMLILKYDNMQPLLRLLLLLFFLTLQAPMKTAALVTTQGTTYSAYQAQSNFELLENDSRYISYQGECVFLEGIIRWKISNNVSFSTPTKRGQLPSNQSSRKTLGKLG